jgi:hypothetical protein
VEIRAYADRIELRQDGRIIGDHRRCFGRDQTVFDPWHYLPVLARIFGRRGRSKQPRANIEITWKTAPHSFRVSL